MTWPRCSPNRAGVSLNEGERLRFARQVQVMVEIKQTATFRAWERQLRDIETAKTLASQWSQT